MALEPLGKMLRIVQGLPVVVACEMKRRYSDSGVAAPGLSSRGYNPPRCSVAATNSAQNHYVPSVLRGHTIDRIMARMLNGFPTCWCANCIIACSDASEQPNCT